MYRSLGRVAIQTKPIDYSLKSVRKDSKLDETFMITLILYNEFKKKDIFDSNRVVIILTSIVFNYKY